VYHHLIKTRVKKSAEIK